MAILEPEFEHIGKESVRPISALVDHLMAGSHPSAGSKAKAQASLHALPRQFLADIVGLAVAALVGPLLVAAFSSNPASSPPRSSQVFLTDLAIIPVFIVIFALYGLYRGIARRISTSVFPDLKNIAHALIISGFLYTIAVYFGRKGGHFEEISVAKIATMCAVALVTVPLARALAFGPLYRASGRSVPVIVVGTGKLADTVASHLRSYPNVDFLGFVDDSPLGRNQVLGDLDQLPSLCREHNVARVVVCFSRTHPERTSEMLKTLAGEIGVSIVPRYYELLTGRSHVEDLSGLPMLDIAPASMSRGSRFLKRAVDIVVSSLVLLVTSPLFIAIAVAIKATSSGPIFFRQVRTGRNEQPFFVLKFRTMYGDAESRRDQLMHLNEVDGPLFKIRDDPRITPIGRFLRRTSLDELAQLLNVWKGDMSLVGPRPFVVSEAMKIEGWARKRFEARPGMTGLWQVSGRNELSYLELCRLDYLYVASWSFWWDIQILWRTPQAIFRGRGAS